MKIQLPTSVSVPKITHLLVILFILSYQTIFCQNIGINSSGAAPNASAMLDIDAGPSNNKGLLIPRVSLTSTSDVTTIPAPATSLMVYNTNAGMTGGGLGYWYWNGAAWAQLGGGGGGSGWSLIGNAGTTAGTNFMGTTDDVDVVFKRNGIQAGWLNNALFNTSWGAGSMTSAATGMYNAAFGKAALASNTSGYINTAIGSDALFSNSTGYDNTATGMETLFTENTGNDNTGDGYAAMYSTTTGSYNTSTGGNSLFTNVSGSKNTADGWEALYNSTGSFNTAVGWSALATTGGGSNNTAIGYHADVSSAGVFNAIVIGSGATAITNNSITLGSATATNLYLPGYSTIGSVFYTSAASGLTLALAPGTAGQVLQTNGAGAAPSWANAGGGGSGWALAGNAGTTLGTNFVGTTDDVALEFRTNNIVSGLIQPDVADGSVDLGFGAGNVGGGGTEGVFIGYDAGTANKQTQNIAIGYKASFLGTTGVDNISMGYEALFKNVTSNANVSIGSQALYNTTGAYNTALGYNACNGTSTGQNNTGIGPNTLNNNLCGCTGGGTGNDNTALGAYAGMAEGTGSNNTYLGYYANCNASGYTNATAIGAYAEVTQSNSLILGGINGINGATASTSVGIGCTAPQYTLDVVGTVGVTGTIVASGLITASTAVTACSDIRFKKNILPLQNSLNNIMKLQGVNYVWKQAEFPDRHFGDGVQVGFIAQELEKVYPQMVFTDDKGYKTVDYSRLTPVLVEGIKEQQNLIDSLKATINNLQVKNDKIQMTQAKDEADIAELKKMIYSAKQTAIR